MLDELVAIHREVMSTTPLDVKRYLYEKINWSAHAVCILGDRGVGKTTLMCQHLLQEYKTVERGLYISADNINVTARGLYNIARDYISSGGEALYIDEIHKYPNWSIEVKNILDTYKKFKVVFSASSSIELKKSKADLSRRVVYHHLLGLSFREYLKIGHNIKLEVLSFENILSDHVSIVEKFSSLNLLQYFKKYLQHGYYPYFLEGIEDYASKLNNVIEKVIFEDIAVVYGLKQSTLPILKKLLWLVATSSGLTPNIDKISSNLGVSREIIYQCLEYLGTAGLIINLYSADKGLRMIRKPGKIYLNNSNLLYAINGTLKGPTELGSVRDTFFSNQVQSSHQIILHGDADFLVDDKYVLEIGGKGKDHKQIKGLQNSYLALDDIEIGFKNKIPLYLFGMLY